MDQKEPTSIHFEKTQQKSLLGLELKRSFSYFSERKCLRIVKKIVHETHCEKILVFVFYQYTCIRQLLRKVRLQRKM
jgi:hypothetical protein